MNSAFMDVKPHEYRRTCRPPLTPNSVPVTREEAVSTRIQQPPPLLPVRKLGEVAALRQQHRFLLTTWLSEFLPAQSQLSACHADMIGSRLLCQHRVHSS